MSEDKCNLPPGFKCLGGMVWNKPGPVPALGPCCACEGTDNVDSIAQIDRRAKVEGHGSWGCCLCGVKDGASVVLCTKCRLDGTPVRFACCGFPAHDGRAPIEEFTEVLDHDLAKHPEFLTPLRN